METVLRLAAIFGAVAHLFFFYKEAVEWDVEFVRKAVPLWIGPDMSNEDAESRVSWAKNLAINMGTYNLILAIGLAWLAIEGEDLARSLGIFLAIWLLGAAAAAAYTKVRLAFYVQGALGVILLIAALAVDS
jgi:uncharacterized membrane protein